jgi:redox-sensitive bicupin YhaK (pirin superfamily)
MVEPSSSSRRVVATVAGQATSDGAGVTLSRVIGQPALPDLDPFLLLDAFGSDDPGAYIAGFPAHPHRGFETVTYMLAGRVRHRDNAGNEGLLGPGSVQWMTAGRGIVHSEMPEQEDGLLSGFQLWVNLPARDKMTAPRYQEFAASEIPRVAVAPGVTAGLIAGSIGDRRGPVESGATAAFYADLALAAGSTAELALPEAHNAFVYVYDGAVRVGEAATPLAAGSLGVLSPGSRLSLAADDAARALVIAGAPLREPVVRYGPFVMNSEAEIHQAVRDYQAGRL